MISERTGKEKYSEEEIQKSPESSNYSYSKISPKIKIITDINNLKMKQSVLDSPTKSRISTKISQSILELDNDLKKTQANTMCSLDLQQDIFMTIKALFVKVNIIIGITNEIKSINLQITETSTISDLIKMSIDIFNDEFFKENLQFRLKTNYQNYSVKPSKKNGKPDKDLPSFDSSAYLTSCFSNQFTLVPKINFDQEYLVLLKSEKKIKKCLNCLIF